MSTQEIDIRIQVMETLLNRLIAVGEPGTTSLQHERLVWRIQRTAASSILSCDFVRKVVGSVVDDCEDGEDNENAETILREADLYMNHVNILYLILTATQLKSLTQDFIRGEGLGRGGSLKLQD